MIFFSRLKDLLSKKSDSDLNRNIEIKETILSPKELKESEKTLEELYPGKSSDEIWDIVFTKELNDEELTYVETSFNLEMIFHHEIMKARASAINQLVNNTYCAYDDEYENRFKELINFTLKYFEKYIFEKPTQAESILIKEFPLMHNYINRHIYKQQNIIKSNDDFDVQKAYDEFLVFCKNYFCFLYPEKVIRDEQLKNQFIMYSDLIRFIDGDS